jgi:exonuclease SbcD
VAQKVGPFSRYAEHETVLNEMVEIAVSNSVDCFLIAGDMFHNRSPHPEEERIVFNFLAELIGRRIQAVAICGNHDHPKRLAAFRSVFSPLGIHFCPEPVPPDEGGIVRIMSRGERAAIAALPHVPERYIVDSWRLLDPEQEGYKDYEDRVGLMMNALARSYGGSTVNILLAHVFLNGAEASGSEWTTHVRLPYAVSPARIPATAQYVALGHLHRAQEVRGTLVPARYAGSPLQLDFSERNDHKSVTLIDAVAGRPAQVEVVPLTAGRRLREVTGTLEELEAKASEFGDDYLRVNVELNQPVAGLADRVRAFLPNAVQIRPQFPDGSGTDRETPVETTTTPEGRFVEWFTSQHQVAPPEALMKIFREVREEAHAAS